VLRIVLIGSALAGCATTPVCPHASTTGLVDDDRLGPVPLIELIPVAATYAWDSPGAIGTVREPLAQAPFPFVFLTSKTRLMVDRDFRIARLNGMCFADGDSSRVVAVRLEESSADAAVVSINYPGGHYHQVLVIRLERHDRSWIAVDWQPAHPGRVH
jgi:hypothetical protein